MAQWLRALAALLVDTGSVPSTYTISRLSVTLVPGEPMLFVLTSGGTRHTWCIDTRASKTPIKVTRMHACTDEDRVQGGRVWCDEKIRNRQKVRLARSEVDRG